MLPKYDVVKKTVYCATGMRKTSLGSVYKRQGIDLQCMVYTFKKRLCYLYHMINKNFSFSTNFLLSKKHFCMLCTYEDRISQTIVFKQLFFIPRRCFQGKNTGLGLISQLNKNINKLLAYLSNLCNKDLDGGGVASSSEASQQPAGQHGRQVLCVLGKNAVELIQVNPDRIM